MSRFNPQVKLKTNIYIYLPMDGVSSPKEAKKQVYAEQVALLYGYAPLAYTVTLINGLILIFIQRHEIPIPTLLVWFACLILATTGRAILVFCYRRANPPAEEARRWEQRYLLGAALAGMIWGSAALLLFPVDSIGHQVFLAFVLAGMTAAGLLVLSSRLEAAAVFLLLVLLPLIGQFFSQGSELHTAMGMMTLLYLGGLLSIARSMYGTVYNSLSLRFDNQVLAAEISSRQQAEEALYREKTRLQMVLAAIGEGVIIIDATAAVEYLNPTAEQLIGWSSAETQRRLVSEIFRSFDEHSRQPTASALETCLQSTAAVEKHTVLMSRDGREYLIDEHATPLWDRNGKLMGAVAVFRDVTEARRLASDLAYQANHDALTHLPNRTLLQDRLEHALARAQRSHRQLAVLFIDLDHFKRINDSIGHVAADTLLRLVAERLQTCVRKEDTVARLGGDEFVILLEDLPYGELATRVARHVIEALSPPFRVAGHEFFITSSIGISVFPKDGEDAQTLLKQADNAMYRAKEQGRNTFQCYTAALNVAILARLDLEHDLRYALERAELRLHYQPQVDLECHRVIGVEALLRWQHPQRGLVSPSEFIPLAEDTGLILPIGEWVLRTACAQAKAWQDQGLGPLRVAVNLSARQCLQLELPAVVAETLQESGLPAACLELEITESLLMHDLDGAIGTLRGLKAMGVQLALDDFGTGYSSLSYLKRFPLDRLKIDRSFVGDISSAADEAAIALAVIALAHSMRLQVLAEGVETATQLAVLQSGGCQQMQGFYFSYPLPAEAVTKRLRENWA